MYEYISLDGVTDALCMILFQNYRNGTRFKKKSCGLFGDFTYSGSLLISALDT